MVTIADIITPAELTGFARAALEDRERSKGSLARFLPHREVADVAVRMVVGANGLVDEARFRALDAEIEIGSQPGGRRVTVDLPAVGINLPVSEQTQLRVRNSSDEAIRNHVLATTRNAVFAVSDRLEKMRGTVLATGKATIAQDNYKVDNDFGRDASMSVTAATLWTAAGAKVLDDLTAWVDKYEEVNGVVPGRIVVSTKVLRLMLASAEFRTVLAGGGSRPASRADLQAVLDANGLPEVEVFSRRTASGTVVPEKQVLLLPEPVDPVSGESELGSTFWGLTLSATSDDYGLADDEQPGIVTTVFQGHKPPMIAEVIADALALPVLANANLAMTATVTA